jgi:ABC-type nitrate/sulfonate/bicarbonate transport system substrate-binding protein
VSVPAGLTVVIALVGLAALPGCRREQKVEASEAIVLALGTTPHAALAHIAVAKGFFAEEGLAVTVQPHEFGRLALASMLAGKADLATVAETPVVFSTLRGNRSVLVATIATSSKGTAVVARRSAGITTPADLMGKRIGVPSGTSAAFFLDTLLVRHRIERDRVRPVDMRPEQMPDALAKGDVQAVAIWSPVVRALQRRLGSEVATFYADDVFWETHGVATRPEVVRDRPSAIRKALRALLRAEAFARERPQEAREIVATACNVDPADVDATWEQFQFRVALEQSLLVLMEEEARWARRAGLVPDQNPPNFAAAIAPEPLIAVKPDVVRLIR